MRHDGPGKPSRAGSCQVLVLESGRMTWTKPRETGVERRRRSGPVADAIAASPPRGTGNAAGASGKRRKGLRETLQGLIRSTANGGAADYLAGAPMEAPKGGSGYPSRTCDATWHSLADSEWQMAVHYHQFDLRHHPSKTTSCQASHTAISEVIGAGKSWPTKGTPNPKRKQRLCPHQQVLKTLQPNHHDTPESYTPKSFQLKSRTS